MQSALQQPCPAGMQPALQQPCPLHCPPASWRQQPFRPYASSCQQQPCPLPPALQKGGCLQLAKQEVLLTGSATNWRQPPFGLKPAAGSDKFSCCFRGVGISTNNELVDNTSLLLLGIVNLITGRVTGTDSLFSFTSGISAKLIEFTRPCCEHPSEDAGLGLRPFFTSSGLGLRPLFTSSASRRFSASASFVCLILHSHTHLHLQAHKH
jgi:hypothetical protein